MAEEITRLLHQAREGVDGADERLYDAVYGELRQLARAQLRRHGRQSLQTTALVHEAYLRLGQGQELALEDRRHFFALSARVMRCVLVDHFRAQETEKRGGKVDMVALDAQQIPLEQRGAALLALDEALTGLQQLDEGLAKVVEMKFFGGFTEVEIGDALGISDRAVRNRWQKAKAWLALQLGER